MQDPPSASNAYLVELGLELGGFGSDLQQLGVKHTLLFNWVDPLPVHAVDTLGVWGLLRVLCVCVCVYVCVNACSSTTMLSCGLLSWLHLLLISLIQAALVFKLNFLCADIEHYCNAVDITCCLMSWFSCAISAACTQTALCLACSCPS